jgi:hypothetical protein
MKAIIFDASTIISMAMNGLFEELRSLKKLFRGKFIMTEEVKDEVIDIPLKIRRFQFQALKVKQLLDEGVFELPGSLKIERYEVQKATRDFLELANSTFLENSKGVHLIDRGEASCLAVSRILHEKRIKNVIAVDERTTRMLVEKPENLKRLLEEKLHTRIEVRRENFSFFKDFKIVRSIELAYIAYKNQLIKVRGEGVLGAMLYGLKLNGASVSEIEIKEIV